MQTLENFAPLVLVLWALAVLAYVALAKLASKPMPDACARVLGDDTPVRRAYRLNRSTHWQG